MSSNKSTEWTWDNITAGIFIAVAAAVAVTIITLIVSGVVPDGDDGSSTAEEQPSVPTSTTPPAVSPPATALESTTGPAGSSPTPVDEEGVVPAAALLELPVVAQDTNDDIDLEAVPASIDGTNYDRALVYSCSTYCNDSSPQTYEVSLGREFRSFTATAGVLDTAGGAYRIDVTVEDEPPHTYQVSVGHPAAIDLDVTGKLRLRIEMFANGELKSPIQAGADTAIGENGGGLPGVALGDPQLLP